MKHTKLMLNLPTQIQKQVNPNKLKNISLCYTANKVKRSAIKLENPQSKNQLPQIIKYLSPQKLIFSNRDKNSINQQISHSKRNSLVMVNNQHQNKRKLNESFTDYRIKKQRKSLEYSSPKLPLSTNKSKHSRKFSQLRVLKTQQSVPQQKLFISIEPTQLSTLHNLMNYDGLNIQKLNPQSTILFNPSFWKNKDVNKIIQSKIRIALKQKCKQQLNSLNKSIF